MIHTLRLARCGYISYCLFVILCVCTVTDFSAEDESGGVKFRTAVYRRPGQGISNFGERCSPRSPKSDAKEPSLAHRATFYL